jgi:hypothetical protein
MKLHNRLIKGEFLSDVDLLFLDAHGLLIYQGLILLAEDSGCLECHPLQIKALAFPMRDLVTPELIAQTISLLVQHGKAIVYENGGGKQYINLPNFLKHQALRSPAPPTIPLPPWVQYHKPEEGERHKCGRYELVESAIPAQESVGNCTTSYELLQTSTLSIPFVSNSVPEGESEREVDEGKVERPMLTGAESARREKLKPHWKGIAEKIHGNFPEESAYPVQTIIRQLEEKWSGKGPEVVSEWVDALIESKRTDGVTVFTLWASYSAIPKPEPIPGNYRTLDDIERQTNSWNAEALQ